MKDGVFLWLQILLTRHAHYSVCLQSKKAGTHKWIPALKVKRL